MLITSPIVVLYIGYPTQLTGTVTERSERASPASRSAAAAAAAGFQIPVFGSRELSNQVRSHTYTDR